MDESRRLEQNPKILAVSVSGGYQFADVPAMGPSVIVVTDQDPDLAQREAQRLANMLWATRDRLNLDLPGAAAAVRQAMAGHEISCYAHRYGRQCRRRVGGGRHVHPE